MPDSTPSRGLLDRLKSLLPGHKPPVDARTAALRARWPHRTGGWIDPNVPLQGWRNRVDRADLEVALRTLAERSGGRVDDAGLAEVLDAAAADPTPMAFRFGGATAYRQVWVALSPEETGDVRVFLMSDLHHVEEVEKALSVAHFHHPEKRVEYDRLVRFVVGLWDWRGSDAPPPDHRQGQEAAEVASRLRRMVEEPSGPILELLRGLRLRARELLGELASLDAEEVLRLDAWLDGRGAPTVTAMRALLPGAAGR